MSQKMRSDSDLKPEKKPEKIFRFTIIVKMRSVSLSYATLKYTGLTQIEVRNPVSWRKS